MELLNPLERIVTESLYSKNKTLEQLATDLSLERESLFFLLQNMIIKGFVNFRSGEYLIPQDRVSSLRNSLSNKQSQNFEIKTIIDSATEKYLYDEDHDKLCIKKVYLTPSEKQIMNSLLHQMETFLSSKTKKPHNNATFEREVFFWGKQSYRDILNHMRGHYQAAS